MGQTQLDKEAKFQDDKIKGLSKRTEGKFYHGPAARYRIAFIDDLMGDIKGKKVLDLGAGNGWNTVQLLEKGAYVWAIDISPESIRHIDERAAQYKENGFYCGRVMDAADMDYEDNTFDLVVGHGILHHILNYEKTIPEILRVLKPGGRAIFNEPLGINPFINCYRRLTPRSRTEDERPLSTKDIALIRQLDPVLKCYFFELFTLLSKPLILLKQNKLANKLEAFMVRADRALLRSRSEKLSFFQKMAWFIVLDLKK